MSQLKEYHFTDDQIDYLLKCVVQSSRHTQDKSIDWIADLANQIEDQIVNHPRQRLTMNTSEIQSVREQIQEDILSYASVIDDEKIFLTDEVLDELYQIVINNDELCQIVINNFDTFNK
jgi:Rad3-related DNA helicase